MFWRCSNARRPKDHGEGGILGGFQMAVGWLRLCDSHNSEGDMVNNMNICTGFPMPF